MEETRYRLLPLHVGQCRLGLDHVLGDEYSEDDRIDFALYVFFADGGPGRRALVDLGPGAGPYINNMFRRYGFFRELPGDPDDVRQPYGGIMEWLDRLGVRPTEIDHVFITHLHADHHGLTDATDGGLLLEMPNAKIHISGKGWKFHLDRRAQGQWNSYIDFAFADFLLEVESQGQLIAADDVESIPGIDVFHLGGHSPCSMAVRIQTNSGPAVVVGDVVYRYDLFEKGIIGRLCTTSEELLAANERLAKVGQEGAIILPCHDPIIAESYMGCGDEWLEAIRPISERAVTGFASATKTLLK
jgi:glyoxylase-like metal-dependent hydrolase (beta-lactamase superfamily II)